MFELKCLITGVLVIFLLDCAEIFSIIFSNLICKNLSALYLKGLFSLTESVETRLFLQIKKKFKIFSICVCKFSPTYYFKSPC